MCFVAGRGSQQFSVLKALQFWSWGAGSREQRGEGSWKGPQKLKRRWSAGSKLWPQQQLSPPTCQTTLSQHPYHPYFILTNIPLSVVVVMNHFPLLIINTCLCSFVLWEQSKKKRMQNKNRAKQQKNSISFGRGNLALTCTLRQTLHLFGSLSPHKDTVSLVCVCLCQCVWERQNKKGETPCLGMYWCFVLCSGVGEKGMRRKKLYSQKKKDKALQNLCF